MAASDNLAALEAQRDVQETVFGPYASRRLGRSLGVNPLPRGGRLCNFDCVYCECATSSWPMRWDLRPPFPEPEEIRRALTAAAERLAPAELDSITIAGNGEPALSPYLNDIVDVVVEARDRDWPEARTVILTNGTMCHKSSVRRALAKLDDRVVKLDAGTNWVMDQINRPAGGLSLTELRRRIAMLPNIIVQSIFVNGPIDNTLPEHVGPWVDSLKRLAPLGVQIYSLDRAPAQSWVRKVPRPVLESIARLVEDETGIPVHVY